MAVAPPPSICVRWASKAWAERVLRPTVAVPTDCQERRVPTTAERSKAASTPCRAGGWVPMVMPGRRGPVLWHGPMSRALDGIRRRESQGELEESPKVVVAAALRGPVEAAAAAEPEVAVGRAALPVPAAAQASQSFVFRAASAFRHATSQQVWLGAAGTGLTVRRAKVLAPAEESSVLPDASEETVVQAGAVVAAAGALAVSPPESHGVEPPLPSTEQLSSAMRAPRVPVATPDSGDRPSWQIRARARTGQAALRGSSKT